MKKHLSLFIVLMLSGLFTAVTAQELNDIIKDLGKVPGAVYQLLDKTAIEAQFRNDSIDGKKEDYPPFAKKITEIELVVLEGVSQEDDAYKKVKSFKAGGNYESLVRVKDEGSDVQILSRKTDGAASDVYIMVVDEDNVVIVKMSGDFTEQDFTDIVEEQTKNDK